MVFDAVSIDTFFKSLQPLLPCEFCRDSYAEFLRDVVKERGNETVKRAFEDRHMVSFVVDLHNKVNTKLAKRRWIQIVGVLRSKLSDDACKELFACETLEDEIAVILDKRPSLQIVRNRMDLYKRDMLNVEGVLLFLLVVAYRMSVTTIWNFILVLATVSLVFMELPPADAQVAGQSLQRLSQSLTQTAKSESIRPAQIVDQLHSILFAYSKSDQPLSTFRSDTDTRLLLMLAKSCGQGSCN